MGLHGLPDAMASIQWYQFHELLAARVRIKDQTTDWNQLQKDDRLECLLAQEALRPYCTQFG